MIPVVLVLLLASGPAGAARAQASAADEARRLMESGDYLAAHERAAAALAARPDDPALRALRERIEVLASSRYARWVALDRARKNGDLAGEGRLRLLVGDRQGAARAFAAALAKAPSDASARLGLAEALEGEPERALEHARRAADAGGTERGRALRLSGELLLALGRDEEAAAAFESALGALGEDLQALRGLARARPAAARAAAGRCEAAAAGAPLWRRAADLRFCARLWDELGAVQEEVRPLAASLALEPDDLDGLLLLLSARRKGAYVPRKAAVAEGEPSVLASSAAAAAFAAALPGLPSWTQAAGERLLARSWLSLGERGRAYLAARAAEEVESPSLPNARVLALIDPGGADTARDLKSAREAVDAARAGLGP